jgi:FeS assembly SUF system regulator
MLRIGKLTDYALLIMSQLAKEPHLVLSATVLADILHLTPSTVSKVLKMLAENDLVRSVRGAEGGYHLAREGTKISVANIISAMEGDLALTECCENSALCILDSMCTLKENWKKINKLVHSMLDQLTIHDMLNPLTLQGVINGK